MTLFHFLNVKGFASTWDLGGKESEEKTLVGIWVTELLSKSLISSRTRDFSQKPLLCIVNPFKAHLKECYTNAIDVNSDPVQID